MLGESRPLGAFGTSVQYQLPPAVRELRDAWVFTLQSAAVVSVLIASVESQLLATVIPRVSMVPSFLGQALLGFSYISLFLTIGATVSSLLLTQELSVIGVRSARKSTSLNFDNFDGTVTDLLTRYNGGRTSWEFVFYHLMATVAVGYICLIAQLVLFVWCARGAGIAVKAISILLAAIISAPALWHMRLN